ncbi:MAG TPA: putative toxin-antitoxin system toxin component, PIN family [Petrimonas sp.]|uniref:putative toxin-antitoxin system toxin component, PIN family n=1 Tax=Petrimonas sp. TaxID=2023866 RepID=UPI00095C75F6|nr:putative toxin-antitoxin system toxin component, PIN family [Petrimonas sp.]OJV38222.1 MAG: putative toxin-antitoxin system toxin component, PIN family [Bacteroidia bacterium 43-41]MEA4948822.1 putative toxin-antitoxin system toxin component, PIN family [Petrimonas sp.]MEA4979590.1 putative toxin-antitoxin system toxin component, PIN family [Petrimonas sp.]MEA5043926.1 putative toxin-antitoxin system toxin component, PIN family [Petrimonas sp.]
MRKNKPIRVVIDTNVWISFIISDKLSEIDDLLLNNRIRLIFSAELIEEITDVIAKPKLAKYFRGINAIDEMFDAVGDYVDFVKIKSCIQVCRDPKDNFLLSLAKDGKADFLITGDKDLLVLNPFGNIEIVSISDFICKHEL